MNDLISRQAAIDYFVINVGFHDEDGYSIADTDELRKIWTEYFDGIPSAQPEIVRCKDCRYYNSEEKECLDLMGHGRRWEEDDFCSYGAKMEVNNESN